MTFSQYYNGLFPYLSDSNKREEFFDAIIGNFISNEVLETCEILTRDKDTKKRFVRANNPNPISKDHAQFLYKHRDIRKYTKWLYKHMEKTDTFEKIEEWLEDNGVTPYDPSKDCAELLEQIFLDIINAASEHTEPDITIPPTSDIEGILEEGSALDDFDKELLRDFQADYDIIIKNCISDSYAAVWIEGKISKQISSLYSEKWEQLSVTFHNLLLRSEVIGALGQLQQLCDILDPNTNGNTITAFRPSVRIIREQLRNHYVKLHPDQFVGILPSSSFEPQWDDEER